MYSLPTSTTLAVFTIASAASIEPIKPFVSTIPNASWAISSVLSPFQRSACANQTVLPAAFELIAGNLGLQADWSRTLTDCRRGSQCDYDRHRASTSGWPDWNPCGC